jgi:hypothetical protein
VNRRIGGVLELLQQHVFAGIGSRDLLGLGDHTAHAFRALCQDELRTIGDE